MQEEKAAQRLGLTDADVAIAVVFVMANILTFIVFVLLAASAFPQSSNFVATLTSTVIASQGTVATMFRKKSKGEDEAQIDEEVSKAGGQ